VVSVYDELVRRCSLFFFHLVRIFATCGDLFPLIGGPNDLQSYLRGHDHILCDGDSSFITLDWRLKRLPTNSMQPNSYYLSIFNTRISKEVNRSRNAYVRFTATGTRTAYIEDPVFCLLLLDLTPGRCHQVRNSCELLVISRPSRNSITTTSVQI